MSDTRCHPQVTPHTPPPSWSLVVPIKSLWKAKSRLADAAGAHRERLALAVALDTVTAATRCSLVYHVIVVTDDPVATAAMTEVGAQVVPDEPDRGLNPALRHGAALAAVGTPGAGVAALSADLPALRPGELDLVLDAAGAHPTAFVPDTAGTGTTLYAAAAGVPFAPAFGAGSRDRHADAGAYELRLAGIDTVRRDVDTATDLTEAIRLGVGPHTAELLDLLPLG